MNARRPRVSTAAAASCPSGQRAGLTANAVVIFLLSWNDLLLPVVMTSEVEQMRLPVLISSIVTLKFFSYTLTYAAGPLVTLPTNSSCGDATSLSATICRISNALK